MTNFFSRTSIVLFFTLISAGVLYLPQWFCMSKKGLVLYLFTDSIDRSVITKFEEKTGINVTVKYYDSVGEFLTEIRASRQGGYDIFSSNDYAFEILRQQKLLYPLNYVLLSNNSSIDTYFKGKYFDPENRFSLPYIWSPYGIVYDKQKFPELINGGSWQVILEPDKYQRKHGTSYRIGMLDEEIESIFIAAHYLQGHIRNLELIRSDIVSMLVKQKRFIAGYFAGNYHYFLKKGVIPLMMVEGALVRNLLQDDRRFGFFIPRSGTLISLQNLGISKSSKNKKLAHSFINFILSTQIGLLIQETSGYNSTNVKTYDKIAHRVQHNPDLFIRGEQLKKLYLLNTYFSFKTIESMWRAIRLA